MWNVTADELVEYLRTGGGRWIARLFALEWDGWYARNRLVRSLAHFALMPYRILLLDFDGAWVERGQQQRVRPTSRLDWHVALRNMFYVMAFMQLLEECGGDPEDIVSELGSPTAAVYERAARIAADADYDFNELERVKFTASSRSSNVWLSRRNHMDDALHADGLGGEVARDDEQTGQISYYVPLDLSALDVLRRAAHALGLRTIPRGPSGGNDPGYQAYHERFSSGLKAKATEIATALVTDVAKREQLLKGSVSGVDNSGARSLVREELEGYYAGRDDTLVGYFVRMEKRGRMKRE